MHSSAWPWAAVSWEYPRVGAAEACGQPWRNIWAPALQRVKVWAGPSPSHNLLAATEASAIQGMSDPPLLYREVRSVFYLEIKDPSTDQF